MTGWLVVGWLVVGVGGWLTDWLVGGWLTVSLCLQVLTLTAQLDEDMRRRFEARTHKVLGSRPSPYPRS